MEKRRKIQTTIDPKPKQNLYLHFDKFVFSPLFLMQRFFCHIFVFTLKSFLITYLLCIQYCSRSCGEYRDLCHRTSKKEGKKGFLKGSRTGDGHQSRKRWARISGWEERGFRIFTQVWEVASRPKGSCCRAVGNTVRKTVDRLYRSLIKQ